MGMHTGYAMILPVYPESFPQYEAAQPGYPALPRDHRFLGHWGKSNSVHSPFFTTVEKQGASINKKWIFQWFVYRQKNPREMAQEIRQGSIR